MSATTPAAPRRHLPDEDEVAGYLARYAERFELPVRSATRVVVWCTGFAPDYGWIALPVLDAEGRPRRRRGVATDAPGLCFAGLRFRHTPTSALLGGVGTDAAFVAAEVARHVARAGAAV